MSAAGARATLCTTGLEHSPTSATGTGWEPTPWRATQRAAWEALTTAEAAHYPESCEVSALAVLRSGE